MNRSHERELVSDSPIDEARFKRTRAKSDPLSKYRRAALGHVVAGNDRTRCVAAELRASRDGVLHLDSPAAYAKTAKTLRSAIAQYREALKIVETVGKHHAELSEQS